MAVFEEPLAAHLDGEPVLVHAVDLVAIPWRNEIAVYAAINHPDGRSAMVNWDLLSLDWRYVDKDQRWFDLEDLKVRTDEVLVEMAGEDAGELDEIP